MKFYSTKNLTLLLTFALTVYMLLVGIFVYFVFGEEYEIYGFVFAAIAFAVMAFFTIQYFLNKFIVKRIEPIYQTVNAIKIPKNILFERIDDVDIISELNHEVLFWARAKTAEISQLKANEQFRKEFLGNVAHELKTPVFNIQGYVLTLLDGGLEDDEINRKYLKRTAKNVKRMISILRDLDTITRLESGLVRLNRTDFNIIQMLEEVIDANEMRSAKYGVKISFSGAIMTYVNVHADKDKIFELFNNLVVNSLKYGKPGGTTSLSVSQAGDKVLVSVEDNGIGISEDDLPHIFERFYRADKSRSRERGGSGLGLAIVKHIIEAHEETIKVKSKLGVGTVFTVSLANKR